MSAFDYQPSAEAAARALGCGRRFCPLCPVPNLRDLPASAVVKRIEKEPPVEIPKTMRKRIPQPVRTCRRCGRTWSPITDKWPKQCPKCKARHWDRAR